MKKGAATPSPNSGKGKGPRTPQKKGGASHSPAQSRQNAPSKSPAAKVKSPESIEKSPASGTAINQRKKNKNGGRNKREEAEWKVNEFEQSAEDQAEEENRLRLEIQQLFTKEGFKFAPLPPSAIASPSSGTPKPPPNPSKSEVKGDKGKKNSEPEDEGLEIGEKEEEDIEWDDEVEWDEEVDEEDEWEDDGEDDDFDEDGEEGEEKGAYSPEAEDYERESVPSIAAVEDEEDEDEGEYEDDADEVDEMDVASEKDTSFVDASIESESESDHEEEDDEEETHTKAQSRVESSGPSTRGPLGEALDALEATLARTHALLAEQEKRGDLRKVVGTKLSMAQKESFLGQMAKLSLHTVKVLDKALQLKQDVHRSLVDKHNLPKMPSELMPPFEDALDVLLKDLRKDTESQGFVENEEKWVQSGLWYRVNKESQKAWMVYASATNQLPELDDEEQQSKASKKNAKAKNGAEEDEEEEELTFEQVYMRQITEALADELDELKEREKIEDETQVTQLVDCLQMGMDFYTDLEKDLCVQGWKRKNNANSGKATKGLHQALQELY